MTSNLYIPPPPRVPDLELEMARGYLAACERWGKEPEGGLASLDPDRSETTTIMLRGARR